MPLQVDVDVDARSAAELLGRLGHRLQDGRSPFLGLLDQLIDAERERFEGRGARWRKIAPSTLRKDAQQGRDPRPMIATGDLRDSLTRRGDPQMIVRVKPGELIFGTRVWYARFHQRGEGQPKRTVVGLTRVQKQRLVESLRDFFFKGL